jgi:branched-chain amino acid transport system ATP-binding protein
MGELLLELKDIWVDYGGALAVSGVSLEVARGSFVCIIGPNGAGKTTVLNTISGLTSTSRGEITFQGQRIDGMPPHEIANLGIALVPEGTRAFPGMTVRENLEMGAYLNRDKKNGAMNFEKVYSLFPILKDRKGQAAGTLSGGERQMLAISCALMRSPKLILLDEPTQGLSPLLRKAAGKTIVELNEQGISVLLAEQDAYLALRLAQRGYLLENGTIKVQGDTKSLSTNEDIKKGYLGI